MSVEENILSLKGKGLERYKQIVQWKKERGLHDPYKHIQLPLGGLEQDVEVITKEQVESTHEQEGDLHD